MKNSIYIFLFSLSLVACAQQNKLQKYGAAYKATQSAESLKNVIAHFPKDADTTFVRNLLGKPIDMGFDYRYLIDSTGENGCVLGAVFHINAGKIDQYWFGEICE